MAVLCYNAVVMYITAVPTRTKEGKLSHPPYGDLPNSPPLEGGVRGGGSLR